MFSAIIWKKNFSLALNQRKDGIYTLFSDDLSVDSITLEDKCAKISNTDSHPISDITLECAAESKSYVYNQAVDIWSTVSLQASSQHINDVNNNRASIDLVAVIDKSGSMSGNKLELVKKTLEFVLTQCKYC